MTENCLKINKFFSFSTLYARRGKKRREDLNFRGGGDNQMNGYVFIVNTL